LFDKGGVMGPVSATFICIIFLGIFVLNWNKKEFDRRDAVAAEKKAKKQKEIAEKEKKEGVDPKNPKAKGKEKKGGGIGAVFGNLFWFGVACFLFWLTSKYSFGLSTEHLSWVKIGIGCFGAWKLFRVFVH
jgi:hypothetical protein